MSGGYCPRCQEIKTKTFFKSELGQFMCQYCYEEWCAFVGFVLIIKWYFSYTVWLQRKYARLLEAYSALGQQLIELDARLKTIEGQNT